MTKKKMSENSLKNLTHKGFNTETAREAQKKSSKAQKENSTFKKEIELALETMITNNKTGKKVSTRAAIVLAMVAKALKGDVQAFKEIRDTAGERPTDKIEATNTNIDITDQKVIDKVMDKLKEL